MSSKYLQRASGFYLSETLPNDWDLMSDDQLNDFVSQNFWQPFKYWKSEQVLDEMMCLAQSFQDLEDELTQT